MPDTVELIKLRRITKYTCMMAVPSAYLRSHGLQPGHQVLWLPDADGVRLKFIPDASSVLHPRSVAPCDGSPA